MKEVGIGRFGLGFTIGISIGNKQFMYNLSSFEFQFVIYHISIPSNVLWGYDMAWLVIILMMMMLMLKEMFLKKKSRETICALSTND